jgi:hypothetical protein
MAKSAVVVYEKPVEYPKCGSNPANVESRKWKRRLRSSDDLRKWLANLLLDVRAGLISFDQARTETYIVSLLLRCIEGGQLENRLDELEQRLGIGRRKE